MVHPHGSFCFAELLAADANRAKALGGAVEFWREVPDTGRVCRLRDPERARFVAMRPNDPA
jgi:predicted enzyme related to lactoylglutathione lyase